MADANESVKSRRLQRSWLSLVLVGVFIILPGCFIGLAVSAIYIDRQPVRKYIGYLEGPLALAPTLFPYMFSAICGHFYGAIALYMSQRGIRLGILEHLVGSKTIFATLERFFLLRNYNNIGFLITIMWCVSPIGSQAFLRLRSTENPTIETERNIFYLGPNFLGTSPLLALAPSLSKVSSITIIYLASLIAPLWIKDSPRDLFNNPKIPSFLQPEFDNDGWLEPLQDGGWLYRSYMGIPIVTDLGYGDTSEAFIQSMSLDFHCNANSHTTLQQFAQTREEPLFGVTSENGVAAINFQHSKLQTSGIPTSFLTMTAASWLAFKENNSHPITIYYGSRTATPPEDIAVGDESAPISLVSCSLSATNLQLTLYCEGGACKVNRVRRQKPMLSSEQLVILEIVITDGTWVGIGMAQGEGQSSQTESFLAHPPNVVGMDDEPATVELWKLPVDVLGDRLTTAFNTFYYAAARPPLGGSSTNISDTQFEPWISVTANVTQYLESRFSYSKPWLYTAVAASGILELMAMTSLILRYMTTVPDIFMTVAGLTIDNERFGLPYKKYSTAHDGLKLARKIRNIEVGLFDLEPNNERGHIAFAPLKTSRSPSGGPPQKPKAGERRYK